MVKSRRDLEQLHFWTIHLIEWVQSMPKLAAGELPRPPIPLHLQLHVRRRWADQNFLPAQPHQPFGCCNRCIAPSSKIRGHTYSRAAGARTRS